MKKIILLTLLLIVLSSFASALPTQFQQTLFDDAVDDNVVANFNGGVVNPFVFDTDHYSSTGVNNLFNLNQDTDNTTIGTLGFNATMDIDPITATPNDHLMGLGTGTSNFRSATAMNNGYFLNIYPLATGYGTDCVLLYKMESGSETQLGTTQCTIPTSAGYVENSLYIDNSTGTQYIVATIDGTVIFNISDSSYTPINTTLYIYKNNENNAVRGDLKVKDIYYITTYDPAHSITNTPTSVNPETENTLTQLNLTITTDTHNLTTSNYGFVEYEGVNYTATLINSNFGVSGNVTWAVNVTTPYANLNNSAMSYNWTYNLTINASDEGVYNVVSTQNLTYLYPRLNITRVYNILDDVNVSVFNGSVSFNGSVYNFSTTTGDVLVPLIFGSGEYVLFVESENLSITSNNYLNVSVNSSVINISSFSFGLYSTNSLNITFYLIDNETNPFNLSSITVQFIGANSRTEVTSNGTLYVDLFSPDDYTILYDVSGYEQGKYVVNIVNRSYSELTLYLTNSSASSLVLITVKDKFGSELHDVQVTIQRYINNSWKTEQISNTDFQGNTEAYYVLSTTFYNHILMYNSIVYFGAINSDANKKVIYAEDVTSGLIFNIDILGVGLIFDYDSVLGVSKALSFINTSNNSAYFRFQFSDDNNVDRAVCLFVYENSSIDELGSSCVTSSSSILTYIFNTSVRNIFFAKAVIDGVVVDGTSLYFGVTPGELTLDWGVTGYVITFLIVTLSFFVFADSPSISIIVGLLALVVLGGLGLVFDGVSLGVMLGIVAVGVIVALIKSESGLNG